MSIKCTYRYSSTWCRREKSWSRHQKLQEDEIGTLTGNVDIPLSGAERINPGHGTKNCKRMRLVQRMK